MTRATRHATPAMVTSDKPKRSNLAVRLFTAALAIPVLLWMLLLGPHWVWAGFVLGPGLFVAAHELFAMTLSGATRLRVLATAITLSWGAALYFGLAQPDLARHFPLFVCGLSLCSTLAAITQPLPNELAGPRMAWLVAGPLYIAGPLAILAATHALPEGGKWILLSMMLAWFADTAGYFAGRFLGGKLFGPRKLSPNISPNKTWEGALGGLFGALVASLLAHFWYLPVLPLVHGVLLALIAGPLGICGDLVESLIKRSTGTKDSGWIIPGHGGLIDRIDALMFTATTTGIYARLLLPDG